MPFFHSVSSSDLFSEPGEGKRAGAEVDDIPVI
jgi:hypothetical protein